MRIGVRMSVATLAMAIVATMPLAALATERDAVRDQPVSDKVSDSVSDVPVDRPSDREVNKPDDRALDRTKDVRPGADVRPDRQIDREVDRITDRCHPRIVDNFRRCLHDDRPHDLNIRHLIWRLIKAHEWEKLVRLLHWLGWL